MLAEDVQITLRLAGKHRWIWVDKILYHRRRDPENIRSFEISRPLRREYRYHLYNQILREWGDEYRAQWRKLSKGYFLEKLVPHTNLHHDDSLAYTIVIPNYNHEQTIVEAINSAIKQSLSPEAILVVDDASTDRSLEKLQFFDHNPKVQIISMEKNSGISHVLNAALPHIKTSYFIQLDADDWMEENTAETLVKAMQKEPTAAFAFGNHRLWEMNSQGELSLVDEVHQPPFKHKYDYLLKLGYMVNPRCYRTECVRGVNGWITSDPWDGRYYEDARMIIRLAALYSWVQIPELLHNVRVNRQKSSDKIQYYNPLRKSFYEEMLRQWGNLYEPVWKMAATGRVVLKELKPKA
ncbi:Hyaluronan synthase [compost metagenome]